MGKVAVKYSIARSIPNISIYHTHFVSYVEYFKFLPFKSLLTRFADKTILDLYGMSTRTLAPTVEMKNYMEEVGIPPEKIVVWGRGVDCIRFTPAKRKRDYFAQHKLKGHINVLFVSRLVGYKETDLLIELSHHLPDHVNLIIVGDGPEEEKMRQNCKQDNTAFLGRLEGDELAHAYASCDLFVFPSISETFGNVVLEALASGLPVVAANMGGPKSIVKHEETGYLVKPKDMGAHLEKIALLASDDSLRQSMSSKARQYAETQSWTMLWQELLTIYRTTVIQNKSNQD